jgi:hypothetical protein
MVADALKIPDAVQHLLHFPAVAVRQLFPGDFHQVRAQLVLINIQLLFNVENRVRQVFRESVQEFSGRQRSYP